jgi:hypothetical protein
MVPLVVTLFGTALHACRHAYIPSVHAHNTTGTVAIATTTSTNRRCHHSTTGTRNRTITTSTTTTDHD